MPGERFHAVAGGHLPHFDGFVAGRRQQVVAGRDERDGRHVVVVAVHGFDALVRLLEVPQLDREV